MEVVPSNVPLSFEVTYDAPNLFVAMNVWDVTSGSPVLTGLPIPMANVASTNTYTGQFTPVDQHCYLVVKTVYTSNQYNTPDPDYAAGSETIFATTLGGGGGGNSASVTSVLGYVNNPQYLYYPDGRMPVFTIYLGDVKPLPLMALYPNLTPLDLTQCTGITVFLPNSDGTWLELTLSGEQVEITNPTVLGQIVASFTSMQSALFAVGELQSIRVTYTFEDGTEETVNFPNCFTVLQVN
jgi:hypothetical protein